MTRGYFVSGRVVVPSVGAKVLLATPRVGGVQRRWLQSLLRAASGRLRWPRRLLPRVVPGCALPRPIAWCRYWRGRWGLSPLFPHRIALCPVDHLLLASASRPLRTLHHVRNLRDFGSEIISKLVGSTSEGEGRASSLMKLATYKTWKMPVLQPPRGGRASDWTSRPPAPNPARRCQGARPVAGPRGLSGIGS